MRSVLVVALLWNASPMPAAAASFAEGRPGGEPFIRVVPGAKELAPASPGLLNVERAAAPGAAIPSAESPGADAVGVIATIQIAEPLALATQLEAPPTRPETLPALQSVESRVEQERSAPGGGEAGSPALDAAFDRWADDGGALHLSVAADRREALPSDERPAAALAFPAHEPPQASAAPPSSQEGPRWHRIFPNMLTTANLWSGVAGAYLASQGKIGHTVAAIIAANVFDALDGRTARALKVKNPLGIDYDSLADMVSFGVAPALLIFKTALLPALGPWGFAIAALFSTAGWFRLSRFNVGAHAEESGAVPHKKSDSFTGLPIPGGAGVLLATALVLGSLPAVWAAPVGAAMTLLAAGAMASRLPYPAFKKGGAKALLLPAVVGLAAVIPLTVLGLYAFIPAAVFGLYLLTGPLIWLWRGGGDAWKKELKRKSFHQLLLLAIPAFYLIGAAHAAIAAAAVVLAVGLIETARLKVPASRPFFEKWFGGIIRAKEADRLSGTFYAALGLGAVAAAVSLLHLTPLLFVAAVLALALGDAASPLVGMRFGFKPFKVMGTLRSVDGTAAGFAVALAIGLALGFPWLAAVGAAFAFSVVDTIPVKPDDNLWIPIVAAAALALLSLL